MRLFKRVNEPQLAVDRKPCLLVAGSDQLVEDDAFLTALDRRSGELEVQPCPASPLDEEDLSLARAVLSVFDTPARRTELMALILDERKKRGDGTPVLIIALRSEELRELGQWLSERALADQLGGVRLILAANGAGVAEQIEDKLTPIFEPSVLKMPVHTESSVSETGHKLFFCISPELRNLVKFVRELAENKISRLYILGGPGTGKTSIAYYYWLCRGRGRFITINLNAESTSDKISMKSLLCGHVPGTHGTVGTREGALSFARDGVCFLDESHVATGVVMQVLMEVLDGGQYLAYGGTSKKKLECAVLFASNRSWERLRSEMHPDEHARLGAIRVQVPDLVQREEDMIAVLAHGLYAFTDEWTTWTAPDGITPPAWQAIQECRWYGNLRTLIRVVESAAVKFASEGPVGSLLDREAIEAGIALWEPEAHESLEFYPKGAPHEISEEGGAAGLETLEPHPRGACVPEDSEAGSATTGPQSPPAASASPPEGAMGTPRGS
ncbi:MAG: sigma 54-interacting transcriptional regulator [Deltaproteobacteria bacterium]|nr:sigma 54-interacting transcriptional regulator [Deltaproteobacteria bacterium]